MSEQKRVQLDIPAQAAYLQVVGGAVEALFESQGGERQAQAASYAVALAVQELCANIIKHSYNGAGGRIQVIIGLEEGPRRVEVQTYDTGQPVPRGLEGVLWRKLEDGAETGAELAQVADPLPGQARGRGLYMLKQLLDRVTYEAGGADGAPRKNSWRLVKRF